MSLPDNRMTSAVLIYDELQHTHTKEQMIQAFMDRVQLSEHDAHAYFAHIHLRKTEPQYKMLT